MFYYVVTGEQTVHIRKKLVGVVADSVDDARKGAKAYVDARFSSSVYDQVSRRLQLAGVSSSVIDDALAPFKHIVSDVCPMVVEGEQLPHDVVDVVVERWRDEIKCDVL